MAGGVGLAVSWGVPGIAVRLVGVSDGEAIGEKAIVVATAIADEVAVNSVTTGTAVGDVSMGEQSTKMKAARARTSQILATNCR